jgi:methionyl-tRNA formyltransferase
MQKNSYIFASCKSWHKSSFDNLVKGSSEEWVWVDTPQSLEFALLDHDPKYIFILHWNWHVPSTIFSKYECVCFHMTDLPFGRGGSPLQNLIVDGFTDTKVSAIQLVDELDAGPIYIKKPLSLEGRAEDIYIRSGEVSIEIIRWIIENKPKPIEQIGVPVLYKRRSPEQSLIPTGNNINNTYDHIRMLDAPGYPLAFIEYDNFKIEFSHAELSNDQIVAKVVISKR